MRLNIVRHYYKAGLQPMPLLPEGKKAPALCRGHDWLRTKKDWQEIERHFQGWRDYRTKDLGIGIVCGTVSGNLEVLDIEGRAADLFPSLGVKLRENGINVLDYPIVRTPSGGYHVYYRCPKVGRSDWLAKSATGEMWVETRAEGSYVVAPGGNPLVHKTRQPYRLIHGDLTAVPTLSAEQHSAIHAVARSFNRYVTPTPTRTEARRAEAVDDGKPPEVVRFNAETTFADLLEEHGWIAVGWNQWRHPNASNAISAGIHPANDELLTVFSTGAIPTAPGKTTFDRYGLWVHLEHDGDFSAALKDLRKRYRVYKPSKTASEALDALKWFPVFSESPQSLREIAERAGVSHTTVSGKIKDLSGHIIKDDSGYRLSEQATASLALL